MKQVYQTPSLTVKAGWIIKSKIPELDSFRSMMFLLMGYSICIFSGNFHFQFRQNLSFLYSIEKCRK